MDNDEHDGGKWMIYILLGCFVIGLIQAVLYDSSRVDYGTEPEFEYRD